MSNRSRPVEPGDPMPFAYYERLSPARKRIYRRSDEIGAIGLPTPLDAGPIVAAIRAALVAEDRLALQRACQRLLDALVGGYRVPPVRVKVLARRPSSDYGELHGLYDPGEDGAAATITVWMRTAQRRQAVAFKSFLRTLTHEFAHHLDYELFLLEETFHTEGFYKRESSLANGLLVQEAALRGPEPTSEAASAA
jgi:hypothetical protein